MVKEIYQQIPNIMFRDEPLRVIMHYLSLGRHDEIFDKSGPYIEFFPSGKVKEIASYYGEDLNNQKGSYREFDESGKVIKDVTNKYSPLPSQENLPDQMVKIIKSKKLWDSVIQAFNASQETRSSKAITRRKERSSVRQKRTKTR